MIMGIDEVGRGSLAGPLVVGSVILDGAISGLSDSKLLTKGSRLILSERIKRQAKAYGLGWVWPVELDKLGLTLATTLAIKRACQNMPACKQIILDGSFNYLPDEINVQAVIKADMSVPAVSAASIIAKVARDQYMIEQAELYVNYGFDTHVGYGTLKHRLALSKYGLTPLHRRSFKPMQTLS